MIQAMTPKAPDPIEVFATKFSEASGRELASSGELKKLREFEKEWWAAWRLRNEKHTPSAANEEWKRQILAGTPETPEGRETVQSRYVAISAQAEAKMQEIGARSVPVIKSVLGNFVSAGESWIEQRADREKSEAAEFGVNFIPSAVLVAAQRCVASHRIRMQNLAPNQSASPGSQLSFLKL